MDNYTHYSLSDFYINNYVNTVYKKYSTFQNVIYVDYYWLDLKHSNFDSNLVSFYTTANNDNHGGRYNLIINLPLMFSTNVPYSTDPTEKGASTVHESEIFAIIDPVLNLRPKEGDFVVYKFENGYYGVYNVTNIDESATMKPSFSKIGMSLSPGISAEKLKKFINGISIFLPQYHYIYSKEIGNNMLNITKDLESKIPTINGYFNDTLDFHTFDSGSDDHENILIDYDYILKKIRKMYDNQLKLKKINVGYAHELAEPKNNTILNFLCFPFEYNTEEEFENILFFIDILPKKFNSIREATDPKNHEYYMFKNDSTKSPTDIFYNISLNEQDLSSFVDSIKNHSLNNTYSNIDNDLSILLNGWNSILFDKDFQSNKKNRLSTYIDTISNMNSHPLISLIILCQELYILNMLYIKKEDKYV